MTSQRGWITWVMLVSGLLTCTMIQVAFWPDSALHSLFGARLAGPVAEIIVRSWGSVITIMGLMLIYGAFTPVHRRLILTVTGVGKAIFIGLVLAFGRDFLGHQVGIAIAVDFVMVVLFALFLVGSHDGH